MISGDAYLRRRTPYPGVRAVTRESVNTAEFLEEERREDD